MVNMRYSILLSLFFLATASSLHAQFGLRASYQIYESTDWQVLDPVMNQTTELPGNSYALGIDYWLRLPNRRIEFLPTLSYARSSVILPDNNTFDGQWFQFALNTHIYPFDLLGDCDCPTFSKQSDFLQKGFFLNLSPGLAYATFASDSPDIGVLAQDNTGLVPTLGAGIGLDLGVSDLMTITPFATARYFLPFSGPQQPVAGGDIDQPDYQLPTGEVDLWQIQAGLRFGFRFDYR